MLSKIDLRVISGIFLCTFLALQKQALSQSVQLRAQTSVTLNEAQSLAIKQNREIQAANLEVGKSDSSLRAIITKRYPSISALAFYGQQVTSGYVRNLAVLPGVFQPITQQYRVGMEVHQARVLLQTAEQRLRLVRQHVVAEVKKTYLTMLALQSSITSRENDLTFLHELDRFVQSEVKRGAALPVDALLVEARVARADYELEKDRYDFTTLTQTLNRLLNRPLNSEISLSEDPINVAAQPARELVVEQALARRPEISELKLDTQRARLEQKIEMSRYIPDVSVGVTGIFSRNLDITLPKTFTSVGFLATWEPWDWGRRIELSKKAAKDAREDTIKLSDLVDSVSVAADKARRALHVAEKEVKSGALAEESTQEQLRVTQRRFKVGAALLKDVLESQTALSKAISDNVKAKTDFATALVELDEASGRDF